MAFITKSKYRFPQTDEDEYKGRIRFTVLETKYKNLVQAASDIINDREAAAEGANDIYGGSFRTYSVQKEEVIPKEVIDLFLPTSLVFNDTIDYANADLGATGAAAAAAIRSGKGARGAVGDAIAGINNSFESFADLLRGNISQREGDLATTAVLRTIGKVSDTVRGAVEVSTGLTLNPNRRSTLRGVGIRQFNFNFNLIPETRKEAEVIKNIIYIFREQMYPMDQVVGGVAVGYKFPSKFKIQMSYDNRQIATKILPCFLTNFNTNYNPNTMSFHENGNFPEINITLSFVEERTLKRQDIKEGY